MSRYLRLYLLIASTISVCASCGCQVAKEVSPTGTEASPNVAASMPGTVSTSTVPVKLSPTPRPTGTLSPIPQPKSTAIPTTTALKLGGNEICYNGISFTVDPVLGELVFARMAPEPPAYTEFSFALEGYCREAGCVTVYSVESFRDYPFGGDIIDALQAAIETGSYEYFPTWGSAILLRAQTQHIRFQNGAGLRAVVMRGQNGFLANNEAVVYDFHGLTDDGQYYVEVIFPIDAPILLSTYDPAENTNEGAFLVPEIPEGPPFGETLEDVMLEYNQEAQRQLDALESSSFTPDLGLLDALVISLLVTSSCGE